MKDGNVIYIYYPNMEDVEDTIKVLYYTNTPIHYKTQINVKKIVKVGYDDDPDEIESRAAELNWEDYLSISPR